MTWELSYERNGHKIVVYENRASYFDIEHKEKFGTIQKNDNGQYFFRKAFFVDGMLDTQISELEKIMSEVKKQDKRGIEGQ